MNLASYLLLDAFQKDCEVAIVFSNDADLKQPIEIAENELNVAVITREEWATIFDEAERAEAERRLEQAAPEQSS